MAEGLDLCAEVWQYIHRGKGSFPVNCREKRGECMKYPEGEVIRRAREKMRLTQYQVAEAAGITFKYYQMLEHGKRSLWRSKMEIGVRICAALQIDPITLLSVGPSIEERWLSEWAKDP